jgi:hypothetical protein
MDRGASARRTDIAIGVVLVRQLEAIGAAAKGSLEWDQIYQCSGTRGYASHGKHYVGSQ